MFVEYLMERRSRLEDISKQSGWVNSPPNPTDGKLMHVYFYRNYIFLKYDIHFNNLVLTNTLGPHKPSRRWTSHSPDGKHHNQIDYILV